MYPKCPDHCNHGPYLCRGHGLGRVLVLCTQSAPFVKSWLPVVPGRAGSELQKKDKMSRDSKIRCLEIQNTGLYIRVISFNVRLLQSVNDKPYV